MPANELLRLAVNGDLASIETRCLEALTGGQVALCELVPTFQALEGSKEAQRVANIGQLVLENTHSAADPRAALTIARIALLADPSNADLRSRCAALYHSVYHDTPGFATLLEASGLTAGRPARNAVRLLELCLNIAKGDVLISRTEDVAVEVIDVDQQGNLYTVRREGRPRTVTAIELSREYQRVNGDDFRVLRQLRPQKLTEMIQDDPVGVVIGLLHVHGDQLDQDTLKHELVPRFIGEREWSGWWTQVRQSLKKNPHVVLEGRSPVILSYTKQAMTLEEETWQSFASLNEPNKQLALVESYLREKKRDRAAPDAELLTRCHQHMLDYVRSAAGKRPVEALACALVAERIDQETGLNEAESRELAIDMLRTAENPVPLVARLEDNNLWDLALSALAVARPADLAQRAADLLPLAPAAQLDTLVGFARKGSLLPQVQTHIDAALADPVEYSELIYWLWKQSRETEGLVVPTPVELFTRIVQVLGDLGRKLNKPIDVTKRFRARMKAALQLRDFAQVRQCMQQTPADRAITLKHQLSWLDGLGDNTPTRMLDLLRDVHPELWRVVERRIEQWEDPNVLWTTRTGLQRKTEERDTLINVTMRDNARRIGEAAQLGDLSENSEYKFALEERDLLRARLAQMNNELSMAQVIEPAEVPTDRVGVGSRVALRRTSDGGALTVTFFGPFDGDIDRGHYNYKAPVSQKLMGLRVGERARVQLEDTEQEYEIAAIENGLA
ncbi:MAG: GreA/GreB family elongation factor [Planctomycetes bacterium]|nr:GreA/GreB family elongation factor [Planctomycetota bacterium]